MLEEQEANTILMSKIFLDFSYFLKCTRNISKTLTRPDASEGTCWLITESLRSSWTRWNRIRSLTAWESKLIQLSLVQRIPRYLLLLQALLKYTPKDDRNLEITVQALQQVSEVALANNEAIRARENENKLIEIIMSFETRSRVNLMDDNNRIFLKEGNLHNNAGGCRYCVCMSSLTHWSIIYKRYVDAVHIDVIWLTVWCLSRRGVKAFRYWLFTDKLLSERLMASDHSVLAARSSWRRWSSPKLIHP